MQGTFFSKDSLETLYLRALIKFSLDLDFSEIDDMFIPSTIIRKRKIRVLMGRSVLDHCSIHKEGEHGIQDCTCARLSLTMFSGGQSDKPSSNRVRDSLQISVKKFG